MKLTPYVLLTLDTTEWESLSLSGCNFCSSVVSNAESYRSQGQHEVGGSVALKTTSVLEPTDTSVLVHMEGTEEPSRVVDEDGKTVKDLPVPNPLTLDVLMHYKNGKWKVRGVGVNE